MTISKLYNLVNEISANYEYWFVRTDSGQYFETFYDNNFIGIGWNEITIEDLKTKTDIDVKEKIAKVYKMPTELPNEKGNITGIYTKLIRFMNLQKGDRVIIPSANSDSWAFGVIMDTRVISDPSESFRCEYHKRRKVKWMAKDDLVSMDPIFYKVRMSRHAISSIREYASYIDKVMDTLYLKNGAGHFILDIEKKENINLKSLIRLVDNLEKLGQAINQRFNLQEDIDSSKIKLNLQSPGTIELILEKGKSLILMATMLSILSCGTDANMPIPPAEKKQIKEFMEIEEDTLREIENAMQELEVNKQKINKIY